MAHSLGLEVVAEGVEETTQLEFLRTHGCDEIQGYLISLPGPADSLAELLRAQAAEARAPRPARAPQPRVLAPSRWRISSARSSSTSAGTGR